MGFVADKTIPIVTHPELFPGCAKPQLGLFYLFQHLFQLLLPDETVPSWGSAFPGVDLM